MIFNSQEKFVSEYCWAENHLGIKENRVWYKQVSQFLIVAKTLSLVDIDVLENYFFCAAVDAKIRCESMYNFLVEERKYAKWS